jgi:hypothetical protein
MTKGLLFWILMILWLIFGLFTTWPAGGGALVVFAPVGGMLLLWILLALLGWQVFGAAVH